MASSMGGDFALERPDPLPRYELELSDADDTARLPSADRTVTDLVPPHPDVVAWLTRCDAEPLDAAEGDSDLDLFARLTRASR